MEFIMDTCVELYEWAWEFAMTLTLWNLFQLGCLSFLLVHVLQPFIIYLGMHLNAFCKPTMFSYQHVVVTGGATGLGKALV